MDTRVTLKQALAMQGFKGGSREETEWSQWVKSEKNILASIMKRYGIEWQQLGTKREHLSVYDYKREQRAKEVAELESKIADKKDEFTMYAERIDNYTKGEKVIAELARKLDTDSDYQLQDPATMMSAKSYKSKIVEPLMKKYRDVIDTVFARYYQAKDDYHRLNKTNAMLYRENERLQKTNDRLYTENSKLTEQNKSYRLLRRVFGDKQIDKLLEQAGATKGKKRDKHSI